MKTYRAALLGLTAGAALALVAPAAYADGMGRGSAKDSGCYPYCWNGFYVGVSAGWHNADLNGQFTTPPITDRANVEQDSLIVGGIIGIQHQFGNVVLGLEANFSGSVQGDSYGKSFSQSADCLGSTANRECAARMEYLFTIGPRLGFTWEGGCCGSKMVYATAGYAQTALASKVYSTANNVLLGYGEASHGGWFVGGGFEWSVSKNVILGLEYQHVFIDSEDHVLQSPTTLAPTASTIRYDGDMDIVRARVTFKLARDCCGPLK